MPDTTLPVSEYVKQGIIILAVLAIALFGIKSCRKYQKKRAIVIELTSHASDSSAYEQFYAKDAQVTLLQAMHQLHLAKELGHTPKEILREIMEESGNIMDTEDRDDLPLRVRLIRDSLLSNYENCKKLGVFVDPSNLLLLEEGELPSIQTGPSTGEDAIITTIIPTSLLEGVDKLIPNLVISPPPADDAKSKAGKPNEFEIARAKLFGKSLSDAGLIEREAYKKIIAHFDRVDTPEPEPSTP